MPATLTDEKRAEMARKLADMKVIQTLIIENEKQFLGQCNDAKLCDRLEDMLKDGQKKSDIVETVITQYGIQSDPQEIVQKISVKPSTSP